MDKMNCTSTNQEALITYVIGDYMDMKRSSSMHFMMEKYRRFRSIFLVKINKFFIYSYFIRVSMVLLKIIEYKIILGTKNTSNK